MPPKPAHLGRQRSSASSQQLSALASPRSSSAPSTPTPPPQPAAQTRPPPPLVTSSDLSSGPSTGETTSSFQTTSSSSSGDSSPYDSAPEGPPTAGLGVASGSGRRELELERAEDGSRGFELGSDAEDEAWDDSTPFIPAAPTGGRRHRAWSRSAHDHRRRRASSVHTSGSLTLFQLTANMLALTLSPTVLALPYAAYLLSPPLFIPLLCAIAGLAAANHLGVVYVARYLGVKRFEDLGRGFGGGRRTRTTLRVLMLLGGLGVLVLYLRMITDLLLPIGLAPDAQPSLWRSHTLVTLAVGLLSAPLLYPSLLQSKTFSRLSLAAALPPLVLFVVVLVKTVALYRGEFEGAQAGQWERARFGFVLGGSGVGPGSVWGGMSIMTFVFSSHVYTLPNHATLLKPSQRSFALSPVLQSAIVLALGLPLALVPYFLLPTPPPPMLLDAFPNTDRWVCAARVCAALTAASSVPGVFIPTRHVVARLLKGWAIGDGAGLEGVGRRGREFYGVTGALWAACVGLALVGGRLGELMPLLGVFLAFALGFLLPALLFIALFHLLRPLSIIFPPSGSAALQPPPTPVPGTADPSTPAFPNPFSGAHPSPAQLSADALLARKERQLQRRRTNRRLWQDVVFFLGGVPLSFIVTGWTGGRLLGLW